MRHAHTVALRLAALILAIGLIGIPDSGVRATEWPAHSYVLQVDGLACPYCGYGVEKQFQQQQGVEGTDIDIESGVVIVHVARGTSFSDAQLREIVHDAGFELGGIKHRPQGE